MVVFTSTEITHICLISFANKTTDFKELHNVCEYIDLSQLSSNIIK